MKIHTHTLRLLFLFALPLFIVQTTFAQTKKLSPNDIPWNDFLSQYDLVWDSISPSYYSGAIMGNGLMGANIYAEKVDTSYRWDIGRSDITDGRGDSTLYYDARLPVGHFLLTPQGEVLSDSMRLSLYDATTRGVIVTKKGSIRFKTFVDANHEVIVIETQAQHGEKSAELKWVPEKAINPRALRKPNDVPKDYSDHPNPPAYSIEKGGFHYSVQALYSGKVYVTAWKITKKEKFQQMLVTVAFEDTKEKAMQVALRTLAGYEGRFVFVNEALHQQWWHNYYPASFAHFGDAKMDNFYWIQQYKLACVTRANKEVIDLMGPWVHSTPWAGIWWNLNIQLTYSPMYTANRMELSEPLWKSLHDHQQALINNVPEAWRYDAAGISRGSSNKLVSPIVYHADTKTYHELGNLTWTMYYYWEYCTYKADTTELLTRFYPLLKRSVAYYSHIVSKGKDSYYHLPPSLSPEYKTAPDCNYDLALLRWGLKTLLDINQNYQLQDTLRSHWEDLQAHLVPYPEDSTEGYIIGAGVKLERSHRHYSHLLMIYPLHEINWDQAEHHDVIKKSIDHWTGFPSSKFAGFSFTGAASMYAMMGMGDSSYSYLKQLIDGYVKPNTLYSEGAPVMETPLSAATSLQEMYLQSWGGKINVFPAVPTAWKNTSFINYRAAGAFLVSAVRQEGSTALIQIESLAGAPCLVETHMDVQKLKAFNLTTQKEYKFTVVNAAKGLIDCGRIPQGETIQLTAGDVAVDINASLKQDASGCHLFGVKKHD